MMKELNRELNNCYLIIFILASMIVTLFIMLTEAQDTIADQKAEMKLIKTRQELDNSIEHIFLTHYNKEDKHAGHAGVRF